MLNPSITLQPGKLSDLQEIHELERRTYIIEGASTVGELEKYLTNPKYLSLTLKLEGNLIGYTFAYIPKKYPYLLALTISKEHRKQGLATILLDEIEQRYRINGFKEINLHVRPNNRRALKLYTERNYKIVKSISEYYLDRPGLKMKKIL
jgi:ribosomal-protein-alanine N-acetyltransferase